MSINLHVDLTVALASPSAAQATFGTPMFVVEHSITANRQDGPYTSVAAVEAAGFTLAAAPQVHGWASQIFAQQPRTKQVMIGRRLANENLNTTMSAIEAVAPASWYLTNIATRTTDDIMAADNWHKSRTKLCLLQSDSSEMLAGTASTAQSTDFTVGGTATDGTYSITVVNNFTGATIGTASFVRGSAETNDQIAAALDAAWDGVAELAAIGTPSTASNVVTVPFNSLGTSYSFTLVAPGPGTLTNVDTGPTQNPGELLSALASNRTILVYHDDDTEYLDASWCGRCLGFNLDARRGSGSWAYAPLTGIPISPLTTAQTTQLNAYNVNWFYAPVFTSGVQATSLTFRGIAVSNRSIKVQISLDWLSARLEEAILNVFTQVAQSTTPAILFDDNDLARFGAAAQGVFERGVNGGHLSANATVPQPDGKDRLTPFVDVPAAAKISSTDKSAGLLTISAQAVVAGEVLSVTMTADLSFGS